MINNHTQLQSDKETLGKKLTEIEREEENVNGEKVGVSKKRNVNTHRNIRVSRKKLVI